MSLPTTPPRVMRGSNGSVAGASGYPPIPAAADNVKYLKGDGTWSALSNASAATNAEASAGTSTATFVTPANAGLAVAGARNALAPRGGVAFDGTSSTRVFSTLTGQNIGTDAFSLVLITKFPSSISAPVGLFNLSPISTTLTNPRFSVYLSGADLLFECVTDNANYVRATAAGVFTAYAGKTVLLAIVRSASGTPIFYINGTPLTVSSATTGTGSWQASVTNTFIDVGHLGSTYTYTGTIYSASLYNVALDAASVLEIYELGGAVPERFKFGTQANLLTGNTANFASGLGTWGNYVGGTAAWDGVGAMIATAPAGFGGVRTGLSGITVGKRYRLTFDVSAKSNATLFSADMEGGSTFVQFTATGAFSGEVTFSTNPGYTNLVVYSNSTGGTATIDNIVLKQVGAVCHLGLADGIGRIARDSSTNKLHAIRTATGVSDVIELDDGIYPQLALTANGELLDTAGVLRTDAVLVDVIVKNTTANAVTAFGLGMSSGVRNLTYETLIPANSTVVLPILRADLAGLTVGTAPYGRVYYSASSWNSGSLNISIRYRRERDL